jgi:carboxyl-terminal processing protease
MSPAPHKSRRIPRRLALFLLLSIFATTALPQERRDPPATPQVPGAVSESAPKELLTAKDRKEVFEKIWKDIYNHYYDPSYNGVDWKEVRQRYAPLVEATKSDQEFYALMSQMTSELHDAHTRFNSPEQWKNFRRQQGVTVGFSVDDVDGKTVVTNVIPGTDAAHAGVEQGMVVLRVNDTPVAERVAEIEKKRLPSSSERATRWFIYNRVFAGPADTPVKVALQRADGSVFEVSVRRQIYSAAPEVTTHVLPSGNVYIRFDGFQRPITKEFRQALQKFRDAPGLIVDLRRNGGGDLAVLLPIAGYFFGRKTLFAKDSTRTGKPLSSYVGLFKLPLQLYVGRPGEQIYSGPVVILVDAHSASSSEVFAAGMQDTLRAKVIGSQSCGCVLGIAKPRVMKGGGVLEMSEVLWFSPKGRKLEGTGIIPDKIVVPSVADLQRRRDPVLAEADKSLVRTAVLESKEAASREGKSEPR